MKLAVFHFNLSNNQRVVPITPFKRFLAASALEVLHLRLISSIALATAVKVTIYRHYEMIHHLSHPQIDTSTHDCCPYTTYPKNSAVGYLDS